MRSILIRRVAIVAFSLFVFGGAARAQVTAPSEVTISADGANGASLKGLLIKPPGAGPFPAVVALHGCGGLRDNAGKIRSREVDWYQRLVAAGYAVLFADSFGSRGLTSICATKKRTIYPRGRANDAAIAADWLAAQPFVDKTKIALIGWSHGGSTVLHTARTGFEPTTAEFKTAIAFYPGCRVPLERADFGIRLPLTIMIGAADDWTPPDPCRALAAKHKIHYVEYPDAYHGFDAPNSPARTVSGLAMTADGTGRAHVGTNPNARTAAIAKTMRILADAFK
jgi:dienelactone hydrolase